MPDIYQPTHQAEVIVVEDVTDIHHGKKCFLVQQMDVEAIDYYPKMEVRPC